MDKYDRDIKFLLDNPERVPAAWYDPTVEPGGSLFQYLSLDGNCGLNVYGCPTMVKRGTKDTPLAEMTEAIRSDPRIPDDIPTPEQATQATFGALCHYQRWADRTFRKTK
jgi:hypothetical protein